MVILCITTYRLVVFRSALSTRGACVQGRCAKRTPRRMAPPFASASDKPGRDAAATTSSLRAPDRPGAPRARRLGHRTPAGTRCTAGAPCPAPRVRAGSSETSARMPATWPEGRMASEARHKRASAHPGNGTPAPKRGSAKVGVPGRRPSGAPRCAIVEPAAGCDGVQRLCAPLGPRFVSGRSAPPPLCSSAGLLKAMNGRARDDLGSLALDHYARGHRGGRRGAIAASGWAH